MVLFNKKFVGLFGVAFLLVVFFQNCGEGFQVPSDTAQVELPSDQQSEGEPSLPPPPPPGPNCPSNEHLEGNICVPNKRSCPVANGTAEETWNGSSYGPCTVVSCNMGYSNQSNACVFSPSSCPITNGNGLLQENGTCQIASCNTGYHVSGNTCASNTQICPVANGVGVQTWNGTAYGTCMVTACNPGFVVAGNTCMAHTGGSSSWQPRNSSRFFLTGHSLTDDPLADYIVDVANRRGDSAAYNQQIIIGSPIRSRTRGSDWNSWHGYSQGKNRDGRTGLNVISELRNPQTIGANQRYDTLVITENHNLLSAVQWDDTIGLLRHYHDRLVEGNPSGKTLFYNSWLDINKSSPNQWIDFEKKALGAWECVASKVNLSLEAAGRSDRVLNMPAGAALVALVERIVANQVPGLTGDTVQRLNAIFSDNVHLTQLGVYYMSLVTYSSVYGKSTVGTTPRTGINAQTAAELQRLSWEFVNNYYNRTAPGTRTMADCRAHISQQVCPAYWTLKGETFRIGGCQDYFGNSTNSQFRWPDSSFVPHPAP